MFFSMFGEVESKKPLLDMKPLPPVEEMEPILEADQLVETDSFTAIRVCIYKNQAWCVTERKKVSCYDTTWDDRLEELKTVCRCYNMVILETRSDCSEEVQTVELLLPIQTNVELVLYAMHNWQHEGDMVKYVFNSDHSAVVNNMTNLSV